MSMLNPSDPSGVNGEGLEAVRTTDPERCFESQGYVNSCLKGQRENVSKTPRRFSQSGKPLQVVFSVTRFCPFRCRMCSMNAGPGNVMIPGDPIHVSRQLARLRDKEGIDLRVDVSGGDPLAYSAFSVTIECLRILGLDRCSVSTTGLFLNKRKIELLDGLGGIDFTFDCSPYGTGIDQRPPGFHRAAQNGIRLCTEHGIPVSVFTILTSWTANGENLRGIQQFLAEQGVSSWTLLPLYAAGRGRRLSAPEFMHAEPHHLIPELRSDLIQPKLQHTFLTNRPCGAFHDVIYISPEGLVAACPWALLRNGRPDHRFVLGDLGTEPLDRILTVAWTPSECPANCQPVETSSPYRVAN